MSLKGRLLKAIVRGDIGCTDSVKFVFTRKEVISYSMDVDERYVSSNQ